MPEKNLPIFTAVIGLLALAGCSAASDPSLTATSLQSEATNSPEPTLTSLPPDATSTPAPLVPTSTVQAESTSTVTPTPERPWLAPVIAFTTSPDAEPAALFTTATQEIFALISYGNMSEGMVVRREWYLNRELWLEREEAWDFAKYGSDGTRTDISIHDFDNGLPEGNYELRLYIDGAQQFGSGESVGRVFTVRKQPAAWDGPIISPDGKVVLTVEPTNRIALQQPDGTLKTLVEADWIYDVVWFPDSAHFAYTNMIGEPNAYPWEIRYDVWIFSVADEQGWRIKPELDLPMRAPVISPDGRKLVVIAGNGYGDACGVGTSAMFIVLDEAFMPADFIDISDFSGLPDGEYESIAVSGTPPVGEWADNSTFNMYLSFICATQNLDGIYTFNLDTMTISQIEQ